MKKVLFTRQQRIIHALMLQNESTRAGSLCNGQAGIMLYLHYAGRILGNSDYTAYAEEFTDLMMASMNQGMMLEFEDGLIGLGWFAEHLIAEGLTEADRDEVLEELDELVRNRAFLLDRDNTLTDRFVYYAVRLLGNRESRPSGTIRALTASFETVLRELCSGTEWLDRIVSEGERFDLLWRYPWMLYYAKKLEKDGYASSALHMFRTLLEKRADALSGSSETAWGCRLLLSFVRGEKYLPEQSRELRTLSFSTEERAWLIVILHLFAREEGREDLLFLYSGLYGTDKGVSRYAGFSFDDTNPFYAFGLHRGLALVGLAGLLTGLSVPERLEDM